MRSAQRSDGEKFRYITTPRGAWWGWAALCCTEAAAVAAASSESQPGGTTGRRPSKPRKCSTYLEIYFGTHTKAGLKRQEKKAIILWDKQGLWQLTE